MRLALVSKRVRTPVVLFLAEPATSTRARACVFSDPLKFGHTITHYRPLGLLLPDGPLSMLGSRDSSRLSRSGSTVGHVAEPKEWSLVRVGVDRLDAIGRRGYEEADGLARAYSPQPARCSRRDAE